jgi:hypothetical protein
MAGFPSHDLRVGEVRIVLALLARRIVEFFLDIGIDLGAFGIRTGMAGPSMLSAFVGVEKAGGRGTALSFSSDRQDIGNQVTQEIKT